MASVSEPDHVDRFSYLAEGNAKQPRKRVAVDVLIRDADDRALLVNPSYKDYWDIPGGMAEANEPPISTAKRELKEELGIGIDVGTLLVVDWSGPHGPWDDQLILIFDGGVLEQRKINLLKISDTELIEFAFIGLQDSARHLRPDMWKLLRSAYQAQRTGATQYYENSQS